jgi:hypothetical protein
VSVGAAGPVVAVVDVSPGSDVVVSSTDEGGAPGSVATVVMTVVVLVVDGDGGSLGGTVAARAAMDAAILPAVAAAANPLALDPTEPVGPTVGLAAAELAADVLVSALLVWPSMRCRTASESDSSSVPSIFSVVVRSPAVTAAVLSTTGAATDFAGSLLATKYPPVAAAAASTSTDNSRRVVRMNLRWVLNSTSVLRSGAGVRPGTPDRGRRCRR